MERYGKIRLRNPVRRMGACDICGTETNVVMDHDHDTGCLRGSLCTSCNFGLGYFHDDPARLQKAIDYLRAAEANPNPQPYPTARGRPQFRMIARQGDGHVRLRNDGRWEASYALGGGKRRSFYGRTRDEAVGKMREARA